VFGELECHFGETLGRDRVAKIHQGSQDVQAYTGVVRGYTHSAGEIIRQLVAHDEFGWDVICPHATAANSRR
jgi:hypothetical protein